ncbi:Pentatricopeptide repeat [Dillenia turbinata]|uniref:Pentatricopeptide repeat n=1 Tax=Dillenia turbinata TaxID=194707 RepID=A0AAN8V1I4_9MAGN
MSFSIASLFSKSKTKFSPLAFSLSRLNFSNGNADFEGISVSIREQNLFKMLKQCYNMKHLNQIHAQIIKTGFEQDLFMVGKIIVFCATSVQNLVDYAVGVFNNVENPDGFMWNTMIRCFVNTNQVENAIGYFKRMQMKNVLVDNFTLAFLLKLCGQVGLVVLGKLLHCSAVKHGLESHVFVRNTLIHVYGMFKEIRTAHLLFEEILRPDLVAWNTIIDCYVNCGEHKGALDLFLRMLNCGMEIDDATLVVTIAACAALGALDFGKWVHSYAYSTPLGSNVSVCNALIDMYAKCGAVEEARVLFDQMKRRNIVTWNTIILVFAMHGHGDEALRLFGKLLDEKLEKPNDVTFLGVICACSHRGMVEEGRKYFNSMTKDYQIQPTIKHYGSMVDLLGRAGFVEEAYELIKSMPMECNAIVWRTLLGACRVHGKIELGERVRRHLLGLEQHSSDYILLSNMYASAGQWSEMMKERKSMRDQRVQKPEPGNSFVGIRRARRLDLPQINSYH